MVGYLKGDKNMTISEIKELILYAKQQGVAQMEVKQGDVLIKLVYSVQFTTNPTLPINNNNTNDMLWSTDE